MGLFRFLLALSVVLEHLGGSFQLIGGWRAVQIFYFVSGFYMSLILNGKYRDARYTTFLGNRLLRLFPIYYISLLLLLARWLTSYLHHVPCKYYFPHCGDIEWQSKLTPFFLIFTQIALLGQDWLFFLKLDPKGVLHFAKNGLTESFQAYPYNINPVSWTLGLELTFYLIAPFLLRRKQHTLWIAILFSISLRLIGNSLLDLSGLTWLYRFFPFEIALFLLGSVLQRLYSSILEKKFDRSKNLTYSLSLIGILLTLIFNLADKNYGLPTLLYYLIIGLCIPALFHLTKKNSFDRKVGELSYPIYLLHMPVCSLASKWVTHNPIILILWVLITAFLVNKLVTEPLDRYRETRLKRELNR